LVANGFMTPDRRLRTRTALLARSLVVQTLGWGAWAWIRSFLERFSGRHGEKKDPCRATWGRDATRIWDWPSSKTWFGPVFEWGVRYNARRCRERGTQEAEERARILHDLRERLSAAADPATGDPVFRLVKPREEAYAGPYVCRAADLILVPKPHVSCVNSPGVGASEATGWLLPVSEDAVRGGNHYGDGVFAATGGPFRRGEVTGIGILDIMPTVLHLFGLRVPADLEGRIVEETFDPSFRAAHPVQRSAGAFKPGETASPGIACTADEGQRMDRRPEEQGSL
jgi:predicted AlkP superfamily phosphohydrolase/phosphomutase